MDKRERKYDCLRSLSCISVVLLHVSGSYWSVVDRESTDFVIMTVYNAFTRFAVPVFMMLSGAFLLEPERNMKIVNVLKRFGKYVLNFYIWSAFYGFQGILFKYLTGKEVTGELWDDSVQRFLWGHYHMWFVFLILGFYLLLPIVGKICESKLVIEYFLILWISISYLIPGLADVIGGDWVSIWINKLSMNMLIGYLGYFILGYYIRKYGLPDRFRTVVYAGGIIGLLYTIMATVEESRMQDLYVEAFLNPSSWNILLWSTAVFSFFAYMKRVNCCHKFANNVARYSFVIYMIHPFFLEKLNMVGVTTLSFHCLISIPILTIVIFAASYVVAVMTKKIPYIKELII